MSFEVCLMVLGSFSEAVLLPTLIVVLRNHKHWKNHLPLRILSIFFGLSFIQLCVTLPNDIKTILTGEKYFNTLFLYNWHNVLSTFVIIAVYYQLLTLTYKRFLCATLSVIFLIFVAVEFSNDSLTNFSTVNFNSYTYNVANLTVVLLCVLYAYQVLQDLSIENITRNPYFWVNTAFLVYYSGTMFVYLFMLVASKLEGQIAWGINSFLLLVSYVAHSLAYYYSKNLPTT